MEIIRHAAPSSDACRWMTEKKEEKQSTQQLLLLHFKFHPYWLWKKRHFSSSSNIKCYCTAQLITYTTTFTILINKYQPSLIPWRSFKSSIRSSVKLLKNSSPTSSNFSKSPSTSHWAKTHTAILESAIQLRKLSNILILSSHPQNKTNQNSCYFAYAVYPLQTTKIHMKV